MKTWHVELASSPERSPLFAADEGTRLHWSADRRTALAFASKAAAERFGRNHFAVDIRVAQHDPMADHPSPLSPAERAKTTGPWAEREPQAPVPTRPERPTLSTVFTLQAYAVEVWWHATLALPGAMLDAMWRR